MKITIKKAVYIIAVVMFLSAFSFSNKNFFKEIPSKKNT